MTDAAELINRRRRQIHVHSIIYYHLNTSIVDDVVFDKWSNELVELHEQNPELISQGYFWESFKDWTGDTGMHLPVKNEVLSLAEWLVERKNNEEVS